MLCVTLRTQVVSQKRGSFFKIVSMMLLHKKSAKISESNSRLVKFEFQTGCKNSVIPGWKVKIVNPTIMKCPFIYLKHQIIPNNIPVVVIV